MKYIQAWQQLTPDLRERIKAFWAANRAVPAAQADKRTEDVVYVVESDAGDIVGVCSAYLDEAPRLKQTFYFFRMFVRKSDRRWGYMQRMFELTYRLLQAQNGANVARGMLVAAENPKFAGPGVRRGMERAGLRYLGVNPKQQHTWIRPF